VAVHALISALVARKTGPAFGRLLEAERATPRHAFGAAVGNAFAPRPRGRTAVEVSAEHGGFRRSEPVRGRPAGISKAEPQDVAAFLQSVLPAAVLAQVETRSRGLGIGFDHLGSVLMGDRARCRRWNRRTIGGHR